MRATVALCIRVLFFRATREELLTLDSRHLAFGLAATWMVGIGRYWDHPNAELGQYLGLGSVIYVFALSALLWCFLRPMRLPDFTYRHLLTYVTLTSPPAILYAIPVERFPPPSRPPRSSTSGSLPLWRPGACCCGAVI
ncbi:MAG: hypothetical protein ACI9WU_005289 [Myxococcota bacterium]|jgi:hypothetical protein